MWLKYSHAPITMNKDMKWSQHKTVFSHHKPTGCWITDDSEDGWREWCLTEAFQLRSLTHKHEVILDESNIIILRTLRELDVFHKVNRVECPNKYRFNDYGIDWQKISQRYDGLIIAPYQYQRRLDDEYFWYYGWDCASGCIWNSAAIRDIRLISVDHDIGKEKVVSTSEGINP